MKMGRIICELERIYGVRQGNNQHTNNVGKQTKISNSLGIENNESYRNFKKLTTLIPELQELVDFKLSLSVSSRIIVHKSNVLFTLFYSHYTALKLYTLQMLILTSVKKLILRGREKMRKSHTLDIR